MTDATLLLARVERAVLYVTLNRPAKHNALNTATLVALRETFEYHARDQTLTAAVLTGAGDQSFAAGGDLVEFDSIRTPAQVLAMRTLAKSALEAVRRFPVPVIAALNGHARGGAAELAVACDLRLSARHARIGFVQRQLAITPAWGGGVDLMRLIGPARALRLLATGELLDAQRAQDLGLVDAVAATGQSVEELTEEFIAPFRELTPLVARSGKALSLAAKLGATPGELAAIEEQSLIATWVHDDHWAAVARVFTPRK